jgi:hypothetical protein
MKDYNLAYLYKITNGVLDYYGSSAITYEKRKSVHMSPSNHCSSKKIINGELPWSMDIIEWFPCSCLEELEDKESWYIKNHPCVNENDPGAVRRAGGKAAYHIKKTRQHYRENAEEINARRSVKHDCILCGGKYTLRDKSTHFKTKMHQKALAEAVAIHSPPPPPTVVNNITNNHCNINNNHK